MTEESIKMPVVVATIAALVWGVWWVPILWMETLGIPGLWAGVAINAGAVPVCLLLVFLKNEGFRMPFRPGIGAAFVGGAVTLYSAAIVETSVVRAVLLFYMAPAWAIILECLFFGRRLRLISLGTMALAILGLLAIFRFEIDISSLNFGDVLALLSGMCWAAGSALVFSSGTPISAPRLTLVTFTSGIFIGAALALGFEGNVFSPPSIPASGAALLMGTLYAAPMMIATLWSVRRLPPAMVSFLLTAEVISGVASAAIFLGSPFGSFEAAGAALIVGAALSEVLSSNTQRGL